MRDEPRIKHCYVWANGMVMTFDQYGQQMPEYQGHKDDTLSKIRAVYDGKIEGEDVGLQWIMYDQAFQQEPKK